MATPYTGPPATIGTTLAAGLVLSGGCRACRRRIEVDETGLVSLGERYGRGVALPDVMERVVCAACGGKADLRVHVPRLERFGTVAR